MIDVVVISNGLGIEKTLASIYIQTIKDKVKVYVVTNKSEKIISSFKDKLDVEEIVVEDGTIGFMRAEGLKCCKNTYVTFINSNDVFYDVFALDNIYKKMDGSDVVFGQVVNDNNPYTINKIEGNLYRRQFLIRNKITFIDNSNYGDNGFNKILLLNNPKFVFSYDLIYYKNNFFDNFLDFAREIINDTIYSVKFGIDKKYDNRLIGGILYDTLIYFSYLYDQMDNKDDMKLIVLYLSKLCNWYLKYEKYVDENVRKMISLYYSNNIELDLNLLDNMLNIVNEMNIK